ncbi:MAG: hypothetical protein ABJB40_03510 [Acidobacteriota bacterium]
MKTKWQRMASLMTIAVFGLLTFLTLGPRPGVERTYAQATTTPTPAPAAPEFDQKAALAKLREQIKGKENDSAEKVYKNIQTPMLKAMPAPRLLSVMEFGYARSLGVTCTHCHVPDKWESEDKPQKQITRDMAAMAA